MALTMHHAANLRCILRIQFLDYTHFSPYIASNHIAFFKVCHHLLSFMIHLIMITPHQHGSHTIPEVAIASTDPTSVVLYGIPWDKLLSLYDDN